MAPVPPAGPPPVNLQEPVWIYLDEAGEEQGPFPAAQLKEWYSQTMFPPETKVKKGKDGEFGPMSECVPIAGAPMPTPPEDEKVKRNIEMVAQKAAENPALLDMVKEKKKEDPNFNFLRGGDGENYYIWCLTSAREAWQKKQQEAYAAAMAAQAAAAAAAAANPRPPSGPPPMGGGGGGGGGGQDIQLLVDQRDDCRRARDWGTADEIRATLRTMGVQIDDQGKSWTGPGGGGQVGTLHYASEKC